VTARIVLIIPPGLAGTTPNHEGAGGLGAVEPTASAFRYPPHTAAIAAAALRDKGYAPHMVDAPALGLGETACLQVVAQMQADLYGVFVSWATHWGDGAFLGALHRLAGRSAPVIALGVGAQCMGEYLSSADCVLQGEPEIALGWAVEQCLRQGTLPRALSVAGLAGHDAHGRVCNLDALPTPAWDLLPVERYPFLTVLSSRGCDQHCAWCPYIVAQGNHWRACGAERVVAELSDVWTRFAPQRIVFRDPVFALDPARVESICRQIIASPILQGKLAWDCESRPEHFDPALLRLMRQAGCAAIKVGLETVDSSVLVGQGRVASEQEAEEYLRRAAALARDCAALGIACRMFVMVGLPGQTLSSAQRTAEWVRRARPATLTVKHLERYPGVRLTADWQVDERDCAEQAAPLLQVAGELARRPAGWRAALRRLRARAGRLIRRWRS
jgi:hypothetical protein